ncbi:hypothetical protein Tco_0298019, partial [Tanacetum coccineum]
MVIPISIPEPDVPKTLPKTTPILEPDVPKTLPKTTPIPEPDVPKSLPKPNIPYPSRELLGDAPKKASRKAWRSRQVSYSIQFSGNG